jgi:hypothetical protein
MFRASTEAFWLDRCSCAGTGNVIGPVSVLLHRTDHMGAVLDLVLIQCFHLLLRGSKPRLALTSYGAVQGPFRKGRCAGVQVLGLPCWGRANRRTTVACLPLLSLPDIFSLVSISFFWGVDSRDSFIVSSSVKCIRHWAAWRGRPVGAHLIVRPALRKARVTHYPQYVQAHWQTCACNKSAGACLSWSMHLPRLVCHTSAVHTWRMPTTTSIYGI